MYKIDKTDYDQLHRDKIDTVKQEVFYAPHKTDDGTITGRFRYNFRDIAYGCRENNAFKVTSNLEEVSFDTFEKAFAYVTENAEKLLIASRSQ